MSMKLKAVERPEETPTEDSETAVLTEELPPL